MSVVHVTGLSQAWWYMNCLWIYATKIPLGTIRKSVDCLPFGFIVDIIYIDVDIHMSSYIYIDSM